ncbi:MAG: hydrogenase, partial [Pseudomonadota bacterium]|nr:hydrogenase [Pseudomonadota bacterium]
YSGASGETEALNYRLFGFYAPLYWEMIAFCAIAPLLCAFKSFRTSFVPMLVLSIAINIGMYTERFLIVATSLSRQYLPDAWGLYVPSAVEISILLGTFALFTTLFLLFVKVFPSVSMYEVKETMESPKKSPPAASEGSPA